MEWGELSTVNFYKLSQLYISLIQFTPVTALCNFGSQLPIIGDNVLQCWKSMCNKWQQNWHSKSLNKTERFKLPDLLQASDYAHVVTNVATQAAACAGCYHPLFWVETGLFWPMGEQDGEHLTNQRPECSQHPCALLVSYLYPYLRYPTQSLFKANRGRHWTLRKNFCQKSEKIQEFLLKLQYKSFRVILIRLSIKSITDPRFLQHFIFRVTPCVWVISCIWLSLPGLQLSVPVANDPD